MNITNRTINILYRNNNILNKYSFNVSSDALSKSRRGFCTNLTNQTNNVDISSSGNLTGSTSKIKSNLKYKFNFGVAKIPHFSKKSKGGEDAYAVHEGMISVADGVGGWNESGVDPSKYSNELCRNIIAEFLRNGNRYYNQPKRIFSEACSRTISVGSCTFAMCSLDLEKQYLHTLNLGDSGYMLLRGSSSSTSGTTEQANPNKVLNNLLKSNKGDSELPFTIIYKSEEQQHSFNFPYQVGTGGDSPEEADVKVHKFEENDIIILATDGLWDNLFEPQILQILKPFYEFNPRLIDLDGIANTIGSYCEKISLNERYKSPFSIRSRGLFLGGKPDDITVVVAQIVKNDDEEIKHL